MIRLIQKRKSAVVEYMHAVLPELTLGFGIDYKLDPVNSSRNRIWYHLGDYTFERK